MMSVACGTIVAKSYVSFARALAESLADVHPELPFFVLLADEVERCFEPSREPDRLESAGAF